MFQRFDRIAEDANDRTERYRAEAARRRVVPSVSRRAAAAFRAIADRIEAARHLAEPADPLRS